MLFVIYVELSMRDDEFVRRDDDMERPVLLLKMVLLQKLTSE